MKVRPLAISLALVVIGMSSFAQPISFQAASNMNIDGVSYSSIAFADVDGDSDMDVLVTGNDGSTPISKLYINDSSTTFSEATGTPFIGVDHSSVAFADVDGDNDMDVLITGDTGSSAGISRLYTNDGNGTFSEVIGTPFTGVGRGSVAFADIDGDQDMDVLVTGADASFMPIAKLYTNDGSGIFSEVTGTPFKGVAYSSVAFTDVDGDQDMDVLITGHDGQVLISKLYTNDSNGNFSEVSGTPFIGVFDCSVAFADVDGDNDMDVLVTGYDYISSRAKLYTNNGSGTFSEVVGTPFIGASASSVAFADVDGDHDVDVLVTGNSGSPVRFSTLYANDGSGTFNEVTGTPFNGVHNGSVAFSDVDGDGDMDLLVTGHDGSSAISTLYINKLTDPSGISGTLEKASMHVFPNPGNGIFHIKMDQSYQDVYVQIFDTKGKLVSEKLFQSTGNMEINLGKVPGLYFITIQAGQRNWSFKTVVLDQH